MSKTKPGFLILIPGNNAIHVPRPRYLPNLKTYVKTANEKKQISPRINFQLDSKVWELKKKNKGKQQTEHIISYIRTLEMISRWRVCSSHIIKPLNTPTHNGHFLMMKDQIHRRREEDTIKYISWKKF